MNVFHFQQELNICLQVWYVAGKEMFHMLARLNNKGRLILLKKIRLDLRKK